MDTELTTPNGRFDLERGDGSRDPSLRAWDGGDLLAMEHLAEVGAAGRTLVVNDGFGALAVGLDAEVSWSDSVVAHRAAQANRARNGLAPIVAVPSTAVPEGPFDVVVVKVPRTLAYLDDLLARLRPALAPGALVVGAGMTKLIHTSTIQTFERHLGPTPTSLARRKARLLLPSLDPLPAPVAGPDVVEWPSPDDIVVSNLPNVFSSGSLDQGTDLLLRNLPSVAAGADVIDLGCGNGVIGATIAARNPGVAVRCVDASHQAVASARLTLARVSDAAECIATDVLDGIDDASADLVVINPPFHAGGARTNEVAGRMIAESRRVLRHGGTVLVVGNRHLKHHQTIRHHFGVSEVVASNPKFVVLRGVVGDL